MTEIYKKQVLLLLKTIPDIARSDIFALHGGTAINLFNFNMPRLSIDIDLTLIPFTENRKIDLDTIRAELDLIKKRLKKSIVNINFQDQQRSNEDLKLICSTPEATVKIEVNQINRGLIDSPQLLPLCIKAQEQFNLFCEIQTVPFSQLWGGKIIAALDRQHPRDMFDIKHLFKTSRYTEEVHKGFLFSLISSNRPIHEIIFPSKIDQKATLENHFIGMTDEYFPYSEFEEVREQLINLVREHLTVDDKSFLLSFAKAEPQWDKFDYSRYPSIKWKLMNLRNLKKNHPEKFSQQIDLLNALF